MSLFKLVEEERDAFYSWAGDGRHIHPRSMLRDMVNDNATHLLPEAYRFTRCVDEQVATNARDRGEIVNYWLDNTPPASLDDARRAVRHIDDGRDWSDKLRHPVWHKPIVIQIRDWK